MRVTIAIETVGGWWVWVSDQPGIPTTGQGFYAYARRA